jgi:hypothetical protein
MSLLHHTYQISHPSHFPSFFYTEN